MISTSSVSPKPDDGASAQLFIDRDRRADTQLTADAQAAVSATCWQPDGLPLAIELAARSRPR